MGGVYNQPFGVASGNSCKKKKELQGYYGATIVSKLSLCSIRPV